MGTEKNQPRLRGNGPGPSSSHVAENLKELRKGLGVDLKELARRLKTVHRPISVSSINRIETGDRRVDADDLFALAVALDAKPSDLLKPNPPTETPTAVHEVFLWEEVKEWLGGNLHLTSGDLFLYWERAEAESAEQIEFLEKRLSRDAAEPLVRVFKDRLEEHKSRVLLAQERCALFDSMGLSLDQYATAERLFKASDD